MSGKRENTIPCVVLGMTANGLSVVRSLGRKGVPVIGIDSSSKDDAMSSRYLKRKIIAPQMSTHEQEFLQCLIDLGKELNVKSVLIPTADEFVDLISRHREELSQYYSFIISSADVVDIFLDKDKTAEFARANDIPHPYTHYVSNIDQINALADQLEYPCIIKPKDSHLWRLRFEEQKVIIVNDSDELKKEYAKINEYGLEIILQQIVVGPDSNMLQYYVFRNNEKEIQAEFCGHKLRQYPPHFGVGCLTKSEYNATIAKLGKKVLNDADYRGITSLAFKLDERNGKPYFLEANIRFPLTGPLAITAGIDYPYIVYRNCAYGDNNIGKGIVQEDGILLLNLILDLGHLARRLRNKEITVFDWLKDLKAKKYSHTYFAMDDLVPFFVAYGRFTKMVFKKIFSAILGKKKGDSK